MTRRNGRRAALTEFDGDFPPADQDVTQVNLPAWDGTTWEDTSGQARGGDNPATRMFALVGGKVRRRGPDMFPALAPSALPQFQPPAPDEPRPWDGWDLAIPVLTRDGLGILCGRCRWRRHADPEAATFRALRRSAWHAGWRKDAYCNWNCRTCKMSPAFSTPHPVAHYSGYALAARMRAAGISKDEAEARLAGDLQDVRDYPDELPEWLAEEFRRRVHAENVVFRDVNGSAQRGKHHRPGAREAIASAQPHQGESQ